MVLASVNDPAPMATWPSPRSELRTLNTRAPFTSSSIKQPIPTLALSNTARTGLWAWAKTAAADLFPEGITLNLACPGIHATDRMRQLGGLGVGSAGDPADFGRVVAFLCSQPAGFVSGAALQVDGAATVGLL